MALARDKRNVLVGEAVFFYAEAYTEKPPANHPLFQGWDDPWMHPGYTEEGVSTSFERETQDHNVEESVLPAYRTVTSSTFTVSLSLAEPTLENMKLGYGGGTITTDATTGEQRLILAEELEELAIGFEGRAPSGKMRRVVVPRVVSSGTVETAYRRAESKQLVPVTLASMCELAELYIADLPIPAEAPAPA